MIPKLSKRERFLLDLLTSGCTSNQAIAERMGVNVTEAGKCASRLYRKLGVQSKSAAAVIGWMNGQGPWEVERVKGWDE